MLRCAGRLVLMLLQAVGFVIIPVAAEGRSERSSLCCARQLRMQGLQVRLIGRHNLRSGNGLLVMNHLSWLDPIVLAGMIGVDFVTSREVERDPVLGPICAKAGCAFVDRRSSRAVREDHRLLAERLTQQRICVFPEATSGDGEGLLPFKPAFFESARQAGSPVQPLVIRYRRLDGRRLDRRSRDRVHWYGDMGFVTHLLGLLPIRKLTVDLVILPPIPWSGLDRKGMARLARAQIAAVYHRLGRGGIRTDTAGLERA